MGAGGKAPRRDRANGSDDLPRMPPPAPDALRLTSYVIGLDYIANAYLPDGRVISVYRRGAGAAWFGLALAVHRELAVAPHHV